MLKVEEGQECAVLCAADDEEGSPSARAAGGGDFVVRQPARTANSARQPPAGNAAGTQGLTGRASGGSGSGSAAITTLEPGPKGGCAAAPPGSCVVEDDYDDDFGDGATATAGDGSSAGDETETFSELSDPGGTEVVFVREGVAVWPGARSERILGRLSLVKQCNVLFMAWLPYSRGVLQADGTFRVAAAAAGGGAVAGGGDGAELGAAAAGAGGGWAAGRSDRTLYAVHPIPLSEVKALRRRNPPLGLGCPSVVVVLTSGVTLPPLYFQRGGVKALISTLKQHVFLLKSASDPNTYLVNDTADPLSRSLSALQLSDVLIGGPPPGSSATFEPGEGIVTAARPVCATGSNSKSNSREAGAAASAGVNHPLLATVTWASPATGLGLAAAAGMGNAPPLAVRRGAAAAAVSGGSGLGFGLGLGLGLGSAVSWCWADQPAASAVPPAAAAAAAAAAPSTSPTGGLGAFEAVDGGSGDDDDADDAGGDGLLGGGGGGRGGAHHATWAYGIVDAINRFVQNVRGTASGWIGALDELDDADGDVYGNYYPPPQYDDEDGEVDEEPRARKARKAALEERRTEGAGAAAAVVCAVGTGTARSDEGEPSYRTGGASGGDGGGGGGDGGGTRYGAAQGADAHIGGGSGSGGEHAPFYGAAAAAASDRARAAAGDGGGGDASEVATAVGDFELLDGGGCWGEAAAHPTSRRRLRPPPLSPEEWAAMFDAEGRLVGEAALRDRVCVSGCSSELRREVWKHLLGMYPRGSTAAQRAETAQKWQSDYQTLRQQWQSMVPAQEVRCGSWRCHRIAVDKDVRRTDRGHPFFAREGCAGLRALRNVLLTHVVYDRDLGYCQGMSDLAAPLLVVLRDEAEAFWAFAALMERLGSNFHSDLQGMTLQLVALRRLVQLLDPPLHAYFERRECLSYYFVFRWLLILFKREFKFDEVLSLWESCWACRRTRHLHLYLAAAVLVHHRRVILSSDLMDFDGMLRFCIDLSGRLELQPLLETAEALVGYAGEAGREVTAGLP